MRRILTGAGLLGAVTLIVYFAWRNNALSKAPLKWKTSIDTYEGVWHVDKDSIYCASHVSAVWGSINSLCRIERESGKVLWRRKKSANGEIWDQEYPFCWTTDTCFASICVYDRKKQKTSKNAIIAISLRDGSTRWEVPVSAEVRSIALGSALYCLTNDGRLTTHQLGTGALISEIDLHHLAGPRASYGGIEIIAKIAIVGSNISQDYTNTKHAKVFLINLKTNQLVTETFRGVIIDGKYVTYNGKEWISYDLSDDEPTGIPIYIPELCSPILAKDGSGAIYMQWSASGEWQLLDNHSKPLGAKLSRNNKFMCMVGETLYFWDYHTLRSVERHTGGITWSIPLKKIDHVSASLRQVLVRCRGDTLYCFDAKTGDLQWKYFLNNEMGSPARCAEGDVIVSEKGNLLCFSTGAELD